MVFLVEGFQEENRSNIILYSRNSKGEKTVQKISDFKPYFYVLEEEQLPDDYRIIGTENGHITIDKEKVKKIYVRKANDIKEVRDLFTKHFEADVLYPNRYTIDKLGEVTPYPLKTLYIDIETNSTNIFPDMENPNQEVISISMIDSFDKKKTKFILKNDKWTEEQIKSLLDYKCKIFNTEEDLLSSIILKINEYDPDIISGWNVENFDLTYLFKRMEQYKINSRQLSPLGIAYISPYTKDVLIRGRIVLDMMYNYMHFRRITNQGKADSYSLNNVCEDVLGESKIEHEENFREMWENDPLKLMTYNMKDSELVLRLNEKLQIIEFYNQIRCKACSQLRNIYQTSILVDNMIMYKLHDKIVLPSKKKNIEDKFDGAFVILPTAGIYKNVVALDLKAMYPNIIKTFNMGYETFNPDGAIQIKEGIAFDDGIGIISSIIRELEIERNREKKHKKEAKTYEEMKFYDWRQNGIKVLANGVYGFLGFPGSRLYKRPVADAVTTIGREIIIWTKKVLEDKGYKVVYGDTDSVYVQSTKDNLLDILMEGNELVKLINKSYEEFAKNYGATENTTEIEFEKVFKKIMFVNKKGSKEGAKKKYAFILYWTSDGKTKGDIKFKGFQTKRSDSPKIARQVQEVVIHGIMSKKTKKDIMEYLTGVDEKIRNKEISDEDIGVPAEIKNELSLYGREIEKENGTTYNSGTPPLIAGARYSNKYLGTRFIKGMKPKFVYIKNVPCGYPHTDTLTYEHSIPDGFIPDYDKICKKIFFEKLNEIFMSAGFGECPEINSNKTTLDNWFKPGVKNE